MTVYDVVYHVRRDDCLLRRIVEPSDELKCPLSSGSFDDFFQELSKRKYFLQQSVDHFVHCLRSSCFFCFFVWDNGEKLHLFNSRAEVTKFLKRKN